MKNFNIKIWVVRAIFVNERLKKLRHRLQKKLNINEQIVR